RMSSDGTLIISGRLKDMIIRGGENVYPLEIEEAIFLHPSVEEVQVKLLIRTNRFKNESFFQNKILFLQHIIPSTQQFIMSVAKNVFFTYMYCKRMSIL